MSGHTPGPWAIVRQDALLVEDGHVAQVGNTFEIRPLPGVPIGDEAADLALIAAAPELLAALQEIVSAADGEGWKQLDASFIKARSAIIKATQTRP